MINVKNLNQFDNSRVDHKTDTSPVWNVTLRHLIARKASGHGHPAPRAKAPPWRHTKRNAASSHARFSSAIRQAMQDSRNSRIFRSVSAMARYIGRPDSIRVESALLQRLIAQSWPAGSPGLPCGAHTAMDVRCAPTGLPCSVRARPPPERTNSFRHGLTPKSTSTGQTGTS
jgi:hypothetical protein